MAGTLNAPIAGSAGAPFAVDFDGTDNWGYSKVAYGTDGSQRVPVDATHGLPVQVVAALPAGTNSIGSVVIASGSVSITGTPAVTVSGSVAVTGTFYQATQPVSAASLPLPTGASTETTLAALNTKVTACNTGAVVISSGSLAINNFPAGFLAAQSGTWTVGVSGSVAVTGTFWQTTQPVSAASLPLPTGAATAAKQPALGTAGTASTDVISVQGITSMTPLKVDGSGVTQPVSGTVSVSGTTTISGTVTANIGTSGSLALDATLTGGTQKSKLVDSAGSNVATVSAGGALKVDASATTQPVSIATAPALVASTATIGNVGLDASQGVAATPYTYVSAGSTNATLVKNAAGKVFSLFAGNTSSSPRWLKIFDKGSAPTVGSDTPVLNYLIPGNTSGAGFSKGLPQGVNFANGISFAITGGAALLDATAILATEVTFSATYK